MIKYFTEIKNRVFLLLIAYFFSIIITYFYKEIVLFIIIQSKNQNVTTNDYFIFTDVTEIFSVYMQIVGFISLHVISFYLFYNVFVFFVPSLFKKEYLTLKFMLKLFCFTWIFSALMSVKVFIPITWDFFFSFQESLLIKASLDIHFEAKIIQYFHFFISFYLISTLYFQLSIFLFIILNYFSASLQNIKKFRKVYYLSFSFITTFLCPDVLSQLVLICVLLVGYEIYALSVLLSKNLFYTF